MRKNCDHAVTGRLPNRKVNKPGQKKVWWGWWGPANLESSNKTTKYGVPMSAREVRACPRSDPWEMTKRPKSATVHHPPQSGGKGGGMGSTPTSSGVSPPWHLQYGTRPYTTLRSMRRHHHKSVGIGLLCPFSLPSPRETVRLAPPSAHTTPTLRRYYA